MFKRAHQYTLFINCRCQSPGLGVFSQSEAAVGKPDLLFLILIDFNTPEAGDQQLVGQGKLEVKQSN